MSEQQKIKIAVLSNVNADCISRQLKTDFDVCPPVGYGDIWGRLLDTNSDLHKFAPQLIFVIIDVGHLIESAVEPADQLRLIDEWFDMFDRSAPSTFEYFISDASLNGDDITDLDEFNAAALERRWNDQLRDRITRHANVHRFPFDRIVRRCGADNFFDDKMWYLGKIPFTHNGNVRIADGIRSTANCFARVPKKILVLDLDNTLWGGVLGEDGVDGIKLSDDGIGAIYKTVQRLIKQMIPRGVMLAVCSKNNLSDVEEVWSRHPHMVLRRDDFVSLKINWQDKVENIADMARELNIGLSSFVFLDDMPNERENVRARLPEVTVAEFPSNIEQLPACVENIWREHFMKARSTSEDAVKTQQYLDNAKRADAAQGMDYNSFLRSLHLTAERVELDERPKARVVQLINKTNQFNLTTRRRTLLELDRFIDVGGRVYAWRVTDKFGDYGIVAVILASVESGTPTIDTFLMSCRIMGKHLENFFIDRVEKDFLSAGYETLQAEYIPSTKNMPVAEFYDGLGYERVDEQSGAIKYRIRLTERPAREFFVND